MAAVREVATLSDEPQKPATEERPEDQLPEGFDQKLVLPAVIVLYGLLAGLAWLWLSSDDRLEVLGEVALGDHGAEVSLAIGTVVGGGLAAGFLAGKRYIVGLAKLEKRLIRMFRGMGDLQLVVVAIFVAVGEELFYRGAMLAAWGFWPTVFVYAALNAGPGMWMWSLACLVLGLLLCLIVDLGGGLFAATLAHALINYAYLRKLNAS